jgi:uncharacterized membrane protein (GlpM family)
MTDLLQRFLLGGVLVSLFAGIGSAIRPKTFAGIFNVAPAIALVSFSAAFYEHGELQVRVLARSMLFGAIALLVYSAVRTLLVRVQKLPVFFSACLAWSAWGIVAASLLQIVGSRP